LLKVDTTGETLQLKTKGLPKLHCISESKEMIEFDTNKNIMLGYELKIMRL
jgi:hypothetical protein